MLATNESDTKAYFLVGYCMIIICLLVLNLVQISWVIYFSINIFQQKKLIAALIRSGVRHDQASLLTKYRNKLLLHKYLLTTMIIEYLTTVCILIYYIIKAYLFENKVYFDCAQYYYVLNIYQRNVTILIEMVFILCTLEVLNLTTLFVKDVYLRNSTHSGMRKKINRFIMRFLLLLALGVSGIGLGIAYILCEVFLINKLVLYYRYSRQLYRSLGMHYEDTKYEFGDTSIEARTALKHKKRYKWSTIWLFIIFLSVVLGMSVNEINVPFNIIGEECIQQKITNHNLTFTNSTIFREIEITISIVTAAFYSLCLIMLIPIYIVFTMYYLCDKFLFVRVYQHIYHVSYSKGYGSLVNPESN